MWTWRLVFFFLQVVDLGTEPGMDMGEGEDSWLDTSPPSSDSEEGANYQMLVVGEGSKRIGSSPPPFSSLPHKGRTKAKELVPGVTNVNPSPSSLSEAADDAEVGFEDNDGNNSSLPLLLSSLRKAREDIFYPNYARRSR